MCKTFLPAYNIAKIIKIDRDFSELGYDHNAVHCHLFIVHSVDKEVCSLLVMDRPNV